MIFEIFRHWLAFVNHLLDAGMGNIAGNNQRSVQVQPCFDRILRQFGQNLIHRTIQVNIYRRGHFGCLFGQEATWVFLKLFQEDPIFGNFSFDISVGTTAHTQTYRTRSGMTGQADHANVVDKIFTAKLRTNSAFLAYFQYFFFPFQVAESLSAFVSFSRKMVV